MIERLQKLGLTQKEAVIYMATLELGIASPTSTIAKKANILRTTAYNILNSLVQKGIVVAYDKKGT